MCRHSGRRDVGDCLACERDAEDRADRRAGRVDGDVDVRELDGNHPRDWADNLRGW